MTTTAHKLASLLQDWLDSFASSIEGGKEDELVAATIGALALFRSEQAEPVTSVCGWPECACATAHCPDAPKGAKEPSQPEAASQVAEGAVGWMRKSGLERLKRLPDGYAEAIWKERTDFIEGHESADVPLYAAQPPQQVRLPLSDAEIELIAKPFICEIGEYWNCGEEGIKDNGDVKYFARAIESAHGITLAEGEKP